jgi:CheY-like chemotaxis protein
MLRPILLIEDNPMDVDLTLRAFAKRKLVNPVEIARDGAEALTWIGKWDGGMLQPAVILLDLKLPKVSGLEVLHILKSHPIYKSIPVVMLTTSKEENDVQAAYRHGANSYIVKPVSFEKFVEMAQQIEIYWNILNTPPVPS